MSFLSILKTVGNDLLVGDQIAAPIVSMVAPAIGAPMNAIAGMVIKAEQVHQGEKQGTVKRQMVMDEFTALLPMFQSALKEQAGIELTIDAQALGGLIDATVAQFNAAKALHDTFKIQKVAQ